MRELSGLIARPDGSLIKGRLSFAQRIDSVTAGGAGGDYILPGFVDLQVNGSHGIDVMTAMPETLGALGGHLAREGTTAFLPTAVTSPIEHCERVHGAVADAMKNVSRGDGAAILGMHLEGPFISPQRLGAHPKLNLEPRGDAFERTLAMRALKLLTLAPELPGALDATRSLVSRGVVVSIGHTDATLDEANAGIAAGARMFTHLYNAMRPLNHRDPGVIAAALAPSPACPAMIPDGVHVHPEMMRLAIRSRGAAAIILTTDKIVFAGLRTSETETMRRGRALVEGGAARLGDGTLAGAIISMLDGVRLMVEKCGVTAGEAAMMAATNPARLIGANDRGRIEPGARADLIVLSPQLELKAVVIAGRELS
jgi:N-acetylglucosamine-6-phosphate deacetylase